MKPAYLTNAEIAYAVLVGEYKALDKDREEGRPEKPPRSQALIDAGQLADRAKSAADADVKDADVIALAALIAPPPKAPAKPAKKK